MKHPWRNAVLHISLRIASPASFRDAPLGAGPESILTIVVMDSGLALRAPRNDEPIVAVPSVRYRYVISQRSQEHRHDRLRPRPASHGAGTTLVRRFRARR